MMIASPVLIIGARSDIGRALARAYAAQGCHVILAARGDVERERADLAIRGGTTVDAVPVDILDGEPERFFDRLPAVPGTVVMVAGLLGDQAEAERVDTAAALIMDSNFNGPARYLLAAARRMEGVASACIIGISSVAGDRGRASNFVYGAAKAGFTAFLSGLRNAGVKRGLHVLTVKPGFVRTAMTAGMKLPGALTAEPDEVAAMVVKAHKAGRDVLYTKGRWRLVMGVIRLIPEPVFKRLSL